MTINIDSIVSLANILKQDTFNEKEFRKYIKGRGTKEFLNHEKNINNGTNIRKIKKELKTVVLNETYKDMYNFYLIKENIESLNRDIVYLEENEEHIIGKVFKEVYKIVSKEMKVKSNIYLYGGGVDGGFTINRDKIFINYGKYIGDREELIKILSHEVYHSRNISIKDRLTFSLSIVLSPSPIIPEIIGKIIEEGIALLIQHGGNLEKDDPTGTLTRRKLMFIKDEFDLLNHILLDAKNGMYSYKKIRNLDIYVLGYYIVTTIYNKKGIFILDDWTVNLKYENIIKEYIEICKDDNIPSGFTDKVKELIKS